MKKKKKNKNFYLLAAIAILAIMIILILIIIGTNNGKSDSKIANTQENIDIQEDEESEISQEDEIRTLSESRRIKRYIGIFFENIENGEYEKEYKKLNEDFKNTYFPTLESFKEYADKYFNTQLIIGSYDNVERLGNKKTGNMYIVWITIGNIYQKKLADDEKLEQTNFVILEHDYNNYEISFSVNEE